MVSSLPLSIAVFLFTNCVLALPSKENDKIPGENLKLTFKNSDDIPAGFFDTPSSIPVENNREDRRIQYPACQDGSGGLCVGLGKCPVGFKVETTNALACKTSQECCYKTPDDETSCRARGGECVQARRCRKAPTDSKATDCKQQEGEVCCVFV